MGRKRDSIQCLSYIKALDGRMPVWAKEPEVVNYGQKNCNQRLQEKRSVAVCPGSLVFASIGLSLFVKHQALKEDSDAGS